ncbi:MAG TPA: pyridoxal phosphate-dependent aminotransferase [Fimbriiglobus sp.]|nr:pyridoxal phosphate-dependent aminotransferase [Fimbriiglobus sp.]
MPLPFLLTKFLTRSGIARHLPVADRLTDGGAGFVKYYSDRVLAAPIEELLDPATLPRSPGPEVMDLNLAAPQFDSPVTAGRVSADRIGNPPAWGLPALREAIADTYRRRDGRAVDASEEVFVTHGATGAFAAVLDAFVNPGNKVVLFDPAPPTFALGAKSRRARVRWVPSHNDGGRLRFDPDALSRAMRGATLVALCEPGNPTGAMIGDEDLERVAWAANRSDVLIYLDESFARFRYDCQPCPLATMPGADRRTLSAGSLTAGYGLGSLRVGWLTGPRHLVRACALTASLAAPYVPTLCQQVALRAVQTDDELFGPVLEEFRARRRYASDKLAAMGLGPSVPAGGFFFWVPVAPLGLDGRAFAERLLREQRVLVGPGCAFGPDAAGFVRVSFAAEDGRLREGLKRLAAFVAGLKGQPVVQAERVQSEEKAAKVDERPPSFSRA